MTENIITEVVNDNKLQIEEIQEIDSDEINLGELSSHIQKDQETPPEESVTENPPAFSFEDENKPSKRSQPPKKDTTPKVQATKQPTRQVMSVAVSNEEYDYLQKVFQARKESGLSANWNHFIKQCINFAVNFEKGWQFGVPKNINKVQLDK